jgi:pSer/pThr/pTyr-binding forkhead associated (FHA) protein
VQAFGIGWQTKAEQTRLFREEPKMASLCLLDDNGITSRRWELGDKPLAVGRGKSSDIMIEDASLSRRHFVVEREGDTYLLRDLDSQNGTWVDGRRARSTKLHHHDCILAGRTIFMFNEHAAAVPAGSTKQKERAGETPALPGVTERAW